MTFICKICNEPIEVLCRLTTYGAFVRYICAVHGTLHPVTLLPPIRAGADNTRKKMRNAKKHNEKNH